MVNVGKREDGLLDWANGINGRLKMMQVQIELYKEGPLTANELMMLDNLESLLAQDETETATP